MGKTIQLKAAITASLILLSFGSVILWQTNDHLSEIMAAIMIFISGNLAQFIYRTR